MDITNENIKYFGVPILLGLNIIIILLNHLNKPLTDDPNNNKQNNNRINMILNLLCLLLIIILCNKKDKAPFGFLYASYIFVHALLFISDKTWSIVFTSLQGISVLLASGLIMYNKNN